MNPKAPFPDSRDHLIIKYPLKLNTEAVTACTELKLLLFEAGRADSANHWLARSSVQEIPTGAAAQGGESWGKFGGEVNKSSQNCPRNITWLGWKGS